MWTRYISKEGLTAVLLLALLVLQACIVYVDTDDEDDDYRRFRGTRWYVEVIVHDGRSYRVNDGVYALTFTNDELSGTADCNDFGASYEVRGDRRLEVYGLYATEVACGPGTLENRFFDVLDDAELFDLRGTALTLSTRRGDALYLRRD
ncbi:MAG: META domain-containing protein [Rhodothermales bacterium]|nr:META domain-containing protein [Rhodothermales bacterium]